MPVYVLIDNLAPGWKIKWRDRLESEGNRPCRSFRGEMVMLALAFGKWGEEILDSKSVRN